MSAAILFLSSPVDPVLHGGERVGRDKAVGAPLSAASAAIPASRRLSSDSKGWPTRRQPTMGKSSQTSRERAGPTAALGLFRALLRFARCAFRTICSDPNTLGVIARLGMVFSIALVAFMCAGARS